MNRAERRRMKRQQGKPPGTYNLTHGQIVSMVEGQIERKMEEARARAVEEGVNQAMLLLLCLPMQVLKTYYWPQSWPEKIGKFAERVLEEYQKWQQGELDLDALQDELWEVAGIRLEESE